MSGILGQGVRCPYTAALLPPGAPNRRARCSTCNPGACLAATEVALGQASDGPISVQAARAMLSPRWLEHATEMAQTPEAKVARLDVEIADLRVRLAQLEVQRRQIFRT